MAAADSCWTCPGHRFQVLVPSLPKAVCTPLCVWRYYHVRADCGNAIKVPQVFALPTLGLEQFWAGEAAGA